MKYPRNYDNNVDNETVLSNNQTGEQIKIIFHDFRLEDSTDCANDWIEIIETDANQEENTLLEKHCGDTIPNVKISNVDTVVTVRFYTDDSDTDKGFNFTWWTGLPFAREPTTTTVEPDANEIFCGGTVAEMDCCGSAQDDKCGYGQGDCDADEQCAGDLR